MKLKRKIYIGTFLTSYNGLFLFIFFIIFFSQIICYFLDIEFNKFIQQILNPIFISIEAAIIFYFISDYIPKIKKRKIQSFYLNKKIKKLKELLSIVFFDLDMYEIYNRFWLDYQHIPYEYIVSIKKEQTILDKLTLFIHSDLKRPREMNGCSNWIDYFEVFLKEEEKILLYFEDYEYIPLSINEKIIRLKNFSSLRSYISNIKNADIDKFNKEERDNFIQLSGLIIILMDHMNQIAEIEKEISLSIYNEI